MKQASSIWYFKRTNIILVSLISISLNIEAQTFSLSNTDYFCQGKELSIDVGIIADDFSILNPCTQYNRELPLDLIFEENFNGNTLNTQNWMGDIGHSKYFNGLDENGNTVGEPSTLDYRWSY